MKFQIATSGLGQKTGVFSVDEETVQFRGKKLKTSDVKSVSTSMSYQGGGRSLFVKLLIKTESDYIKLNFTGTDSFFYKTVTVKKVGTNFILIRKAVFDYTGPYILNRLMQSLSSRGEIAIGSFKLSAMGITYTSSIKGESRAGWADEIELRPNDDPHLSEKIASFFGNPKQVCDRWSVFFRNRYTGKVIRLGEFSFEDENGYFLLFLIPHMKTLLSEQV